MTALFVKIFAERNCGATELGRSIKRGWAVTEMRGTPELDRTALRGVLQSVPPRDRAQLHNHMLDMEHDRILYSDFGWAATAPSTDIIQSAAHAIDTLFVGITMHPLAFAAALRDKPRTPGAATKEMPLAQWLTTPFPVHRRDGLTDQTPLTPLELWSAKARALLALAETDRTVILLRSDELRETAHDALSPHLTAKDGTQPEFSEIDIPDWESELRQMPPRLLQQLRLQIDAGVMQALGHDPI
ncbi:hypothetical protein SAMN06273572_10312 [Monaibacterium marinum]|uniref:Sulfotransferase family protein n=1 Tax=Pontivivens marinum TaxID=1690039 RepID=A0A2C9CRV5_9RHOB|nr:hypothetical protein [Monaibacterium marinum]SOH93987.1 hypothetical protein SAMN06273572_10312 [Monaibacterium marinum]